MPTNCPPGRRPSTPPTPRAARCSPSPPGSPICPAPSPNGAHRTAAPSPTCARVSPAAPPSPVPKSSTSVSPPCDPGEQTVSGTVFAETVPDTFFVHFFLGLSEVVAEGGAEARGELIGGETVVLGAVVLNLDGSHEGRQASDGLPVHVVHEAIEQAGAIGVAATGGVVDGGHRDRGDVRAHVGPGVDHRALPALGDDQGLDPVHDVLLAVA